MSPRPGCGRFGALMLPAIILLVAGVGAASPSPSLGDSTQGMRMLPKWPHNLIKEGATKDFTSTMGSCPGVGQASPGYLNGLQARYRVAMRASRHFIGAGVAKLRSLIQAYIFNTKSTANGEQSATSTPADPLFNVSFAGVHKDNNQNDWSGNMEANAVYTAYVEMTRLVPSNLMDTPFISNQFDLLEYFTTASLLKLGTKFSIADGFMFTIKHTDSSQAVANATCGGHAYAIKSFVYTTYGWGYPACVTMMGIFNLDTRVCILALVLTFPTADAARCNRCFGNFASCNFATSGVCIADEDARANTAIVTAGAGAVTLVNMLATRFLRVWPRPVLDLLVQLAARPAPGTPLTIIEATSTATIMNAISSGQATLASAHLALTSLIEGIAADAANAAARIAKLSSAIKSLEFMSKSGDMVNHIMTESYGVYTYVWAKSSEYVMVTDSTAVAILDLSAMAAAAGTSSQRHILRSQIYPPTSMEAFSEMLNMWLMYICAIGLGSVYIVTKFLQEAVHERIRIRGKPWQFAYHFMLVCFRKVEDSGGILTLADVMDKSHINSMEEEAERKTEAFFRTRGGTPQPDDGKTTPTDKDRNTTIKYNGKFTKTGRPCLAFNTGQPHKPHMLNADGSCKGNHVCDQWCKGKKGTKCLSTSHSRRECDNANKCSADEQA